MQALNNFSYGIHQYRAFVILIVFLGHLGLTRFGWFFLQGLILLIVYFSFVTISATSVSTLLKKRVIRLVPIYFGYLAAVALVFKNAFDGVGAELLSLTYNFRMLWQDPVRWGPAHNHLWTIALDIQLIILIAILCKLKVSALEHVMKWVLILAIPFKFLVVKLLFALGYNTGEVYTLAFYTPLFQFDTISFGYFLFHKKYQISTKMAYQTLGGTIAIFAAYGVYNVLMGNTSVQSLGLELRFGWYDPVWIYTVANLFNFSLFIILLRAKVTAKNKFMNWLGDISYVFYVFHLPILEYFYKEKSYPPILTLEWFFVTLKSFSLTFVLSSLAYVLVDSYAKKMTKKLR